MSTDAPTTEPPEGTATDDDSAATDTDEAPRDEQREAILARITEALGDAVVGHHIRAGDDLWVRVTREAWSETGRVARDRLGCRYFGFLSAIDWMPSPFGRYLDAEIDAVLAAAAPASDAPAGDAPAPSDDAEGPADHAPADDAPAADAPADDAPAAGLETGYAGGDTRFQVFARVVNIKDHWGVTFKVDLPDDDLRVDTWIPNYAGANWHERECWEMFGIAFTGHPFLRHLYLPGAFEGHPLRKDFPLLARLVKPWPGIVDVEEMPPLPDDGEGEGGGEDGGESSGDDASAAAGEGAGTEEASS